LEITGHEPTPLQMNDAIARSNEIQGALWAQVKLAVAKDNAMVPPGLYIQALNETFDDQEKRLTAFRNRIPNIVLLALYGVAIVAIGFSGYARGTEERRWRLPVYIMSVLVAAVILLIQDIDRPGAGFISVSQQPMTDTAAALEGYSAEFEDTVPRRPK
jgi:protein-S-isoprenylcysteine O-methyltransferase Ste14